ncbi:MAG: HPP family protein [Candidatus Binataceae bacterium]|jgi:hypothetical protein
MHTVAPEVNLRPHAELGEIHSWYRLGGELIALAYIAVVAIFAVISGAAFVLFPELGALSHDVFTRPAGKWASAPLLLIVTPVLTGAIGICFTRLLPYGYLSVLLTVGGAVGSIILLKSPVAPAISAGLLPLVIGVKSWWYPPSILISTAVLAVLSVLWQRFVLPRTARSEPPGEALSAKAPATPRGYFWLPALFVFILFAVTMVKLTGLRFILFPPLVVIGFEMLRDTTHCPWAHRPLSLPIACFLAAASGLLCFKLMGEGPLTAACAMLCGILVLRVLDLHMPPVLAVALLPLVMNSPGIGYPVAVGIGTLLMALWFMLLQRLKVEFGQATGASDLMDGQASL